MFSMIDQYSLSMVHTFHIIFRAFELVVQIFSRKIKTSRQLQLINPLKSNRNQIYMITKRWAKTSRIPLPRARSVRYHLSLLTERKTSHSKVSPTKLPEKTPALFYDEWLNKKLNLAAARQRWKLFALRPLFTCRYDIWDIDVLKERENREHEE